MSTPVDLTKVTRVEIAPHLDLWMRGDRYGTVVRRGKHVTHVRLDKSGRTLPCLHTEVTPV
jgi:hypothetical protein